MNILESKVSFGISRPNIKVGDTQSHKQKTIPYCSRELYGLPKGITITTLGNRYPNLSKLSQEELFDIQFNSGTKLSNNSVLIRPIILSLGTIDIRKIKGNELLYTLSRKPVCSNTPEETKIITEDELLNNRSLCRGAMKEISPGVYEMVFLDKNGEKQNVKAEKKECLTLLKDNFLYI